MAAAASTALTVATIIATNILHARFGHPPPMNILPNSTKPNLLPSLSVFYLAAATFVGIVSAIVGLLVYRVLVDKHIMTPKVILIINAVIVSGAMVYVLYSKSVTDLFVIASIVGTQVGPINAFSRSIVSRLTPTRQQSKFFSLYEFSQVNYTLDSTDVLHRRTYSFLTCPSCCVPAGGHGLDRAFDRGLVDSKLRRIGHSVCAYKCVHVSGGAGGSRAMSVAHQRG